MNQTGEGTGGTEESTLGKRPGAELTPADQPSGGGRPLATAGVDSAPAAASTDSSSVTKPAQSYVELPDHAGQQQQLQQQRLQQQHQLQRQLQQQQYQLQQQQQQQQLVFSMQRAAAAFAQQQQQGRAAGTVQGQQQQPGVGVYPGQQTSAGTVGVRLAPGPSPRVPSPSQNAGGTGQRIASLPGIVGIDRAKTPVPIASAATSANAAGAYGAGTAAPIHAAGVPSLLTGAPGTGVGVYPLALGANAGATVLGAASTVASHAAGAGAPRGGALVPSLQAAAGLGGRSPGSLPQSSQGGGIYVPGGDLTASAPQGEVGIGAVGGGTQPALATGAGVSTAVGGGEAPSRVGGKVNLVYKLMVLQELYKKMKATREPGYEGGAFTWKTTDDEYRKHQQPMFEDVLQEWEELTEDERKKYGCTNYESTSYPTMSTAKSFFSDASKRYHHYKNNPKSTMQGKFWKDASPTMAAMLALLQANSNDGDGSEARGDATGRAQRQNTERLATRKAQQEAAGSVAEIFGSLQEQAESLGNRNQEDVQRAEEHLTVARETKEMLATTAKESAEREKERDRLTDEFRQQQIQAQNDRARKQAAQHEQFMDVFSDEIRVPAGGVTIPWQSYEEFWLDVPKLGVLERDLVESKLSLDELMEMAKEKQFANDLTSIGIKKLDAMKIANLIKRKVYGK